jgi:acyl-CoA thioesterase-2
MLPNVLQPNTTDHVPVLADEVRALLALEPHGPDTFVGVSPPYGWGRIYGGQVIAQALWAAAATVPRSSQHAWPGAATKPAGFARPSRRLAW